MGKQKIPVTAAVRVLRAAKVDFQACLYTYVEKGGTEAFALEWGVDEHEVIKTLIMERDDGSPLVVLMHGDKVVSTKALARQIGCKYVRPCEPQVADRHSGYQVGGTSPLGTRATMPVYVERSIGELEKLYLNGGKRGFLIRLSTRELVRELSAEWVDVSQG